MNEPILTNPPGTVARRLADHYDQTGLEAGLLAALVAAGKDIEHLRPGDLQGADEFHAGGAQATAHLAAQLRLAPDMHLLDVGSGLGGPARHLATAHGCRVTGIDLTPSYVAAATSLTRRMGLQDRVTFRLAHADRLDFPDASFDGVLLLHVGMNIPDKASLIAAFHRVLKPGGFLAIYDIMRTADGALAFPLPWSGEPGTSFVESPTAYRVALAAAGFTVEAEHDRGDFARDSFAALRARQAQSGPSPLGLQHAMGPTVAIKVANMAGLIGRGIIAPTEMIARRR